MNHKELLIGVSEAGVMHATPGEFDVETRFRMVKEAGVFDYLDKTPSQDNLHVYRAASAKHGLPLAAGNHYYFMGRDEALLEWHLRLAADFGARVHNVLLPAVDVAGKPITDRQVADLCLRAAEWGERAGVTACFEVHVDAWSEHFLRVERVAELLAAEGVDFALTYDPAHIVYKLDNPEAQRAQGMDADVAAGKLELDPFKPDFIGAGWIAKNYVRHAHARAAAPNGPRNIWQKQANGEPGRAIQYPFVRPGPGEWHSEWREDALAAWKEAMLRLLRHHAANAASRLTTISTEFIPFPDYGGGAKYSVFEQNVACARWLRAAWSEIRAASH